MLILLGCLILRKLVFAVLGSVLRTVLPIFLAISVILVMVLVWKALMIPRQVDFERKNRILFRSWKVWGLEQITVALHRESSHRCGDE